MSKNNYFENDNIDAERLKRQKARKRKKTAKCFLTVLGLIVVAVAVFLITVKICVPDFDFKTLIPDNISQMINADSKKSTTPDTTAQPSTAQPATAQPTTQKPESELLTYLPAEDFAFKTSVQGNHLGNLLNGGKIGTDMTYIYHISNGDGIYRFEPNGETYAKSFSTDDSLSSLNLRGEYFYYVDDDDNCLYQLPKGTSKAKKLAENVKFAYVYDATIYYITTNNSLCTMSVKEQTPTVLYSSDDNEMNFVGISLDRVFVSVTGSDGTVEYYTVQNAANSTAVKFKSDSADGEIKSLQLENGYMYYYQRRDDGSYDLIRQKFGSEKTVTLLEGATTTDYVTVDSNRVYYSDFDGSKYRMKEINMNNNKTKVMLTVNSVGESNTLKFYHGGEYDFIIGKKSDGGGRVYISSSNLTSSTDTMRFKNGKWSY